MNTKMKMLLVTALTLIAGAQAAEACIPPRDPHPAYTPRCPVIAPIAAQILKADRILPSHSELYSVIGAALIIDSANRKISMPIYCPPNAMCIAQVGLEFKLLSVKKLQNGIIQYQGILDTNAVGVGTTLTVTDFSNSTLDSKVAAFTVIEYSTQVVAPGARKHTSVLFADRLMPLYRTM